jgi:uncharacterized cupredoxin-like copper-binding protein
MRRRALLARPLLLAGCARRWPALPDNPAVPPGIDWAAAQPVEVTLDEYHFAPDALVFTVNRPLLLRLVNRGGRAHDFTAPGFFATVAFRPEDPDGPTIRAARGSVEVPARATREVTLAPLSPGTWDLECVKPLHGMFGMTGTITVLPAT